MTDKAPAAPISMRRVEELAKWQSRMAETLREKASRYTGTVLAYAYGPEWEEHARNYADTAGALEALVRLVVASSEMRYPGRHREYLEINRAWDAALAQFDDDRGLAPDHREKP